MTDLPPYLDHPAVRAKCSTCEMARQRVDQCEMYKCCWAWARRGHEQRAKYDARNAADRRPTESSMPEEVERG